MKIEANRWAKNSRGVSLIEMMIVMLILSSLLLITVPVVSASAEEREFNQFVEQLEKDMYYYKMLARTEGRTVQMRFSGPKQTYGFYYGIQLIERHTIPSNVHFRSGTIAMNDIYFYPTGTVRSSGTIFIERDDKRYRLTFQFRRGRFYVERLS
ncbi:competence type IV pilus minor pilin ComGD [Salisediminibacterium halotolerans]|uniref:competence type IV pilus minor pilin ComGD n=1 Tax=Salisediminibacterium halotolerans TaxID=517425 RepID=UPI000EABBDAD|nr:competence type IV pilus minor pilin ComGD [Salisediminibacterium halotolerans]GEL06927.1 hypothetical protein SHA02_03430 [Salisediminibacterium halotolerans]